MHLFYHGLQSSTIVNTQKVSNLIIRICDRTLSESNDGLFEIEIPPKYLILNLAILSQPYSKGHISL